MDSLECSISSAKHKEDKTTHEERLPIEGSEANVITTKFQTDLPPKKPSQIALNLITSRSTVSSHNMTRIRLRRPVSSSRNESRSLYELNEEQNDKCEKPSLVISDNQSGIESLKRIDKQLVISKNIGLKDLSLGGFPSKDLSSVTRPSLIYSSDKPVSLSCIQNEKLSPQSIITSIHNQMKDFDELLNDSVDVSSRKLEKCIESQSELTANYQSCRER